MQVTWMNNLGEHMQSPVLSQFTQEGKDFVVVYDWRQGLENHGFIVLHLDEDYAQVVN